MATYIVITPAAMATYIYITFPVMATYISIKYPTALHAAASVNFGRRSQ